MSLFLLTFFTISGGAHAYALLKARAALGLGIGATLAAIPLLAALMCAPLIVHFLSRGGHEPAARAVAWAGYLWMGLLFCFLWTNLALDAVNLAARAGNAILGRGARPALAYTRPVFLAMAGIAVALAGYGALEASRIRVERLRVATEKLPPGVRRVRIAQISDLHLGLLVRHRAARGIARILDEQEPDIVVSTGDLVDGQINRLEGLAEIFAQIRPPLGKYAVTGNHEYYAGIVQSLDFTNRAGFAVLRGEAATPGDVVRIAGVDDEMADAFGDARRASEAAALGSAPSPLFTVLLKHRPRIAEEARGLFDLQLSGHTHGGQIFPFRFVVGLPYPMLEGVFPLGGGGLLRVSRGTGTWGPPMRVLAPPEVTIIDIARPPGRL
ncbi:MAG: metallophosphoesterase [Deltaproteobacteria bacterium]|nr:metallophosphoesterase [Deltaproteobacteria bacterium]